MGKILVTGFEPFDGGSFNPSLEAAMALPDKIDGVDIIKLQLPVVFKKAADMVLDVIGSEKPSAVVMLGVAGKRDKITPEVIAVNIDDARIADNEGNKPLFQRIEEGGPDGIFSSLPVKKMVDTLNDKGFLSELSYSAGSYVCNDLFYRVLFSLKEDNNLIPTGFIHVPMPDADGESGLLMDDICKGIEVCVKTVIDDF
ncbi:pyroglutamyl-peptidase [Butyrivibrio sp. ob235]|uniref:pyroglutamyl-peptidase I n=1 Tax=Butyrivibrio sp. ob235 TaxID=1761780 RepID=UPI0008CC1DCD|nr:pyroglutamyl-peptidase I [Butyrivibrio sp. ob235]SEM00802.1 pyroglutamyl-peptidase [Butyrivibrio sp. ob235]